MLVHTDCFAHPPWACGGNAQSKDEAMFVAKDGPAKGGVLCCRWKPALKL
jgi:hypothetical protein